MPNFPISDPGTTITFSDGSKTRLTKKGTYDQRYKSTRGRKRAAKTTTGAPVERRPAPNTSKHSITWAVFLVAWVMLGLMLLLNVFFSYIVDIQAHIPLLKGKMETVKVVAPVEALEKPVYEVSTKTAQLVGNYPEFVRILQGRFDDDWLYVAELLARESTWSSRAVNPSSGACGLFQALPCSKMGCKLGDAECQLIWGEGYVLNRYGTFKEALEFHDRNGWY